MSEDSLRDALRGSEARIRSLVNLSDKIEAGKKALVWRKKQKARTKARNEALKTLSKNHPEEYKALREQAFQEMYKEPDLSKEDESFLTRVGTNFLIYQARQRLLAKAKRQRRKVYGD